MSSNEIASIYFINFIIITQVLSVLSTITEKEYTVDQGKNVTITCKSENPVMWIRKLDNNIFFIQANNVLFIANVSENDAGIYFCISKNDSNDSIDSKNLTIDSSNDYHENLKINLKIRTTPGPVDKLEFKASTILGYLIWKFNPITNSGGYYVKSFTAEYRNLSHSGNQMYNWSRLDPINISPNVRQMEIYHLEPNTTYEFRIWANNQLGAGAIVTTNVTTLPEIKEEDLIRLIQTDIDNFDPRVWIGAVSIFLGTLVILATGLCIVLTKEFNQASTLVDDDEDGLDSIELVPNIILNPGFCESDDQETPYTRTIIFGEDDESDGYDDDEEYEPPIEAFKRKVSIFFTGHTIKRI